MTNPAITPGPFWLQGLLDNEWRFQQAAHRPRALGSGFKSNPAMKLLFVLLVVVVTAGGVVGLVAALVALL